MNRFEPVFHPVHAAGRLGQWGRLGESVLPMWMMPIAPCGKQGLDVCLEAMLNVGRAEVAVVGQQLFHATQLLGQASDHFEHWLDLLLVSGHLRHGGRHNQHALGIDRGLRVVALLKTLALGGHDARISIGEINLVGGAHTRTGRCGRLAARFLSSARGLVLARFHLRIKLGFLLGIALGGTRLDLRFGLPNRSQAFFAPREFLRDAQALGQRRLISGLPVSIKLDAFAYSIYGSLEGTLTYLSSDTLAEQAANGQTNTYYRAQVCIDAARAKTHPNPKLASVELKPGMTATVDIRTGQRSVLKYLAKPFYKAFGGALNER